MWTVLKVVSGGEMKILYGFAFIGPTPNRPFYKRYYFFFWHNHRSAAPLLRDRPVRPHGLWTHLSRRPLAAALSASRPILRSHYLCNDAGRQLGR